MALPAPLTEAEYLALERAGERYGMSLSVGGLLR
jgi:hypothetical protein